MLTQALKGKSAGLRNTNSIAHLIMEGGRRCILSELLRIAGHPALSHPPSAGARVIPRQRWGMAKQCSWRLLHEKVIS